MNQNVVTATVVTQYTASIQLGRVPCIMQSMCSHGLPKAAAACTSGSMAPPHEIAAPSLTANHKKSDAACSVMEIQV